jgi:hypothetical protein
MDLKNDAVAQATLKGRKKRVTLKADFDWAVQRIEISQHIANDALEYFLLINDNTVLTLKQPWRYFAKGIIYCIKIEMQSNHAVSVHFKNLRDKEIETLLRLGTIYEK